MQQVNMSIMIMAKAASDHLCVWVFACMFAWTVCLSEMYGDNLCICNNYASLLWPCVYVYVCLDGCLYCLFVCVDCVVYCCCMCVCVCVCVGTGCLLLLLYYCWCIVGWFLFWWVVSSVVWLVFGLVIWLFWLVVLVFVWLVAWLCDSYLIVSFVWFVVCLFEQLVLSGLLVWLVVVWLCDWLFDLCLLGCLIGSLIAWLWCCAMCVLCQYNLRRESVWAQLCLQTTKAFFQQSHARYV